MAKIALDTDTHRAAKPPISVHPAFPAIIALWFSALLGLGALVLPPAMLDRFVATAGIASLVPALTPPLAFGSRSLIALVAGLAGAALGLAVGRRMAGAHALRPESPASRRPVSVEEIGTDGVVNGEAPPIDHRRALAIAEDEHPSDFLYVAPIPDEDLVELREATADEPEGETAPGPAIDELDPSVDATVSHSMEPLPFSAPSLSRQAPQQVALTAQHDAPEVSVASPGSEQRPLDPPAAASRPAQADIDAALRAALATLQHLRGAA